MEPERSGSSSQRPLGLSSRVAFWYLRSVLPVSSNGRLSARLPETATSAFDFNERFAGPCRSSVPFFRQWTIRPLALIDPNARSGALVPMSPYLDPWSGRANSSTPRKALSVRVWAGRYCEFGGSIRGRTEQARGWSMSSWNQLAPQ